MQLKSFLFAALALGTVGAALLLTSGAEPVQAAAQAPGGPSRPALWAPNGKHARLTPDNCVLALIDHQTGLMNLVHNAGPVEFKDRVIALAKTAKLFNLPTVITTSAETGPNGPYLPEVVQLLPGAPIVSRPGQINAFDNPDFVTAIQKTGRKKIVMAGITTDVCVAFAALSALDAGYEVYVVIDASGTTSVEVQNASVTRMAQAGATIGTWFALSCELLSDWRNPEGAGSGQLFVEHMPSYAEIFHSHAAHSKGR